MRTSAFGLLVFGIQKVDGTDNVYTYRIGNSQSVFIVTNDGVIATDPVGYGRPQGGATYLAEIRKVGRIRRTFGLKPHVTESFKISPDPQLIEKIRDVVGLYMNPPTNAVVFSFDEKAQIQALERAQPILPMDIGQPEYVPASTVAISCGAVAEETSTARV